MTLTPGARLGPYEITTPIGAGGMGEVYKARDTRLDRSVAIKVLPPEFSADPDRRARFEREAKTIAGLSHPHICTLYDVGEHEGSTFLVMEHLTGETLAQRREKGPLPLEQALGVATEIADALSAAHRQGVVHRDLKPGNVMLTKAGAKLLDFGLAKLKGHGEQPAAVHLASAPTQSTPLTGEGMIVGTLQYMAPEQLEGKPADARTDLWALGAILYEMVTGKHAFEGGSAASLITAIMSAEPSAVSSLRPLTPPSVDRLVRKCLAKAPDERWDSAHDVADELRWMREGSGVGAAAGVQPRRRTAARTVLWVSGGLLLFALGLGVMWLLKPSTPGALDVVRTEVPVSPAERLDAGLSDGRSSLTRGGSRPAVALSPDGRTLVFVGRQGGIQRLFVRPLGAAESKGLEGTEGGQCPAFSPDGRWLAFWGGGSLKKIPAQGGPVVPVCPTLGVPGAGSIAPFGLAWTHDNRLIFADARGGLLQVAADGGKPSELTRLQPGEVSHRLPHVLPGGPWVLFTVRKAMWVWGSEEIAALSLATGERKTVLRGAADARYVRTGHLVYLQLGTLMARRVDAETLEPTGEAVGLIENLAQSAVEDSEGESVGGAHVAIAESGTLIYVSGGVARPSRSQLVWTDRGGHVTPLPIAPRPFKWTPVSPGDGRVAVVTSDTQQSRLWITDVSRDQWTPVTSGGDVGWSRWMPDGQRLVFFGVVRGRKVIALHDPRSGAAPVTLFTADVSDVIAPSSWSPDGKVLAVAVRQRDGTYDVSLLASKDGGTLNPFVASVFNEFSPEFSPDGNWIAYVSDESGRLEVYLRPYPGPGRSWPVSNAGGTTPAWNPSGHELFYLTLPDERGIQSFMTVDVSLGSAPRIGFPRKLFDTPVGLLTAGVPVRRFDVSRNGSAFLALRRVQDRAPDPVTHINLILNWFEELKAKVPATK